MDYQYTFYNKVMAELVLGSGFFFYSLIVGVRVIDRVIGELWLGLKVK